MADLKRRIAQFAREARSEGSAALPNLSGAELDAVIAGRASPVIMSRFETAWKAAKKAAWVTGAAWAMQDGLSDAQLKEILERTKDGPAGGMKVTPPSSGHPHA